MKDKLSGILELLFLFQLIGLVIIIFRTVWVGFTGFGIRMFISLIIAIVVTLFIFNFFLKDKN